MMQSNRDRSLLMMIEFVTMSVPDLISATIDLSERRAQRRGRLCVGARHGDGKSAPVVIITLRSYEAREIECRAL
jgi:hypothetical protein